MRQIANPKRAVIAIPGVRKRCRDEEYLASLNAGISSSVNNASSPSGAAGVVIEPFVLSPTAYGSLSHAVIDTHSGNGVDKAGGAGGIGGSTGLSTFPTIKVGASKSSSTNVTAMPGGGSDSNSTAPPSTSSRVAGPVLRPLQPVRVRYLADEVDYAWLDQYNHAASAHEAAEMAHAHGQKASAGGKMGGKGSAIAFIPATGETVLSGGLTPPSVNGGSEGNASVVARLMAAPPTPNHINIPTLEDGFTLLELHYRYVGYAPPARNFSLRTILTVMNGSDIVSSVAAVLSASASERGHGAACGDLCSSAVANDDSPTTGASSPRSRKPSSTAATTTSTASATTAKKSANASPTLDAVQPQNVGCGGGGGGGGREGKGTLIYGVPTHRLLATSDEALRALESYWLIRRSAAGLHNDGLVPESEMPSMTTAPTGGKQRGGNNSSSSSSNAASCSFNSALAKAQMTVFSHPDMIPSHRKSLIPALCRDEQVSSGPHGILAAMAPSVAGSVGMGSSSSHHRSAPSQLIFATDVLSSGDELSAFADYAVPFMHRTWDCPVFVQQPTNAFNDAVTASPLMTAPQRQQGPAAANSSSGACVSSNNSNGAAHVAGAVPTITAMMHAAQTAANGVPPKEIVESEALALSNTLTRYATVSTAVVEELRQRELTAKTAQSLQLYQLAILRREAEELFRTSLQKASDAIAEKSGGADATGPKAPLGPLALQQQQQQLREIALVSAALLPNECLLSTTLAEEEEW